LALLKGFLNAACLSLFFMAKEIFQIPPSLFLMDAVASSAADSSKSCTACTLELGGSPILPQCQQLTLPLPSNKVFWFFIQQ
jgi:hypothetical protein